MQENFPSLDGSTNDKAKRLSCKIQHQSSCRCFDERLSTQCHEQGTGRVGQMVKYNKNTWTLEFGSWFIFDILWLYSCARQEALGHCFVIFQTRSPRNWDSAHKEQQKTAQMINAQGKPLRQIHLWIILSLKDKKLKAMTLTSVAWIGLGCFAKVDFKWVATSPASVCNSKNPRSWFLLIHNEGITGQTSPFSHMSYTRMHVFCCRLRLLVAQLVQDPKICTASSTRARNVSNVSLHSQSENHGINVLTSLNCNEIEEHCCSAWRKALTTLMAFSRQRLLKWS